MCDHQYDVWLRHLSAEAPEESADQGFFIVSGHENDGPNPVGTPPPRSNQGGYRQNGSVSERHGAQEQK